MPHVHTCWDCPKTAPKGFFSFANGSGGTNSLTFGGGGWYFGRLLQAKQQEEETTKSHERVHRHIGESFRCFLCRKVISRAALYPSNHPRHTAGAAANRITAGCPSRLTQGRLCHCPGRCERGCRTKTRVRNITPSLTHSLARLLTYSWSHTHTLCAQSRARKHHEPEKLSYREQLASCYLRQTSRHPRDAVQFA